MGFEYKLNVVLQLPQISSQKNTSWSIPCGGDEKVWSQTNTSWSIPFGGGDKVCIFSMVSEGLSTWFIYECQHETLKIDSNSWFN